MAKKNKKSKKKTENISKKKKKQKINKSPEPQQKNVDKNIEIKPQEKVVETETITVNDVFKSINQLVIEINQLNNEPIKFKDITLHSAEYKALNTIREHEPISTKDLADLLEVTRSAILKTTKKLIDKNLIKKEKSLTNGRILEISLTEKGLELTNEAPEIISQRQAPILNTLNKISQPELKEFNSTLEKILNSIIK